jgi:gamma-glutamylaminecyclotransferase
MMDAQDLCFNTLNRGFALHDKGPTGTIYVGADRTVEPFPVLIARPWFAPMMLNELGSGLQVMGELYLVDDAGLVRLDALESIGKPGNFRTIVQE